VFAAVVDGADRSAMVAAFVDMLAGELEAIAVTRLCYRRSLK
jgi:hypothetical protein